MARKIKVIVLVVVIFVLITPFPQSYAAADLHLYHFIEPGIMSLIDALWDSEVGAFKDSPSAHYMWWADDQGKVLSVLAEYADMHDWGFYADAAAGFIDQLEYDGLVLRRKVDLFPVIVSSNPMNFTVYQNWLYEVRGNLSRSDYQRFTISYKQSDFNITCIQGQSIRYDQSGLLTELVKNPSVENGASSPDYWYSGGNTGGYRYGPELVSNPDVETPSPYRWYTGGGMWTTAESHSASHSLLLNLSSANGDWRAHNFTVVGGAEYRVQGWFKGSISSGEWFLTIRWFANPDGTGFISEYNIVLGSYSQWTLVEQIVLAPTNAQSADIMFRSINGSGALYGDDFSVRRRTTTQGYVWSSSQARTGNRSLLIDVYEASAEWRSHHFRAVPNKLYNVTTWIKGNVTDDEFYITIRWFSDEAATQFISEYNIPIPVGSHPEWTIFTANVTSPANALSSDLLFRAINADGTVYADDFSVKKYDDDTIEYTFETAITDWMIVDRRPQAVDLIQVAEDGAIKVVFNYTLAKGKPYLLLNVTVMNIAQYELRNVWIHNAFDQLDFYGTPIYQGAYPLGYTHIYFPGVGDLIANNTKPQHFLPQPGWNRNYFVIHMHDIPDIFDRSLAIAVILENKTNLEAIDNVEIVQPGKLHWLKMYYALQSLPPEGRKFYTMKYVFLNAHDWSSMEVYDRFFSDIDSYENMDLSTTHQYGSILYGLAKLYYHTGNIKYYMLFERIWNYYYNMFMRTQMGTYLQSFPYAIKAAILMYKKTNNATYYHAADTLGKHLLSRQQTNPLAKNYGGFREWGGAEYVYLDFEAPAGGALKDLYELTGNEAYRYAHQLFAQSLFIDRDGYLACYRDPEGKQVDTDLPTYKASLFLVASTLGWNNTLTLTAMSHIWQRTVYTPEKLWINVTYSGLHWGQEPSSESMGWGLAAWLSYARYMASVCNGIYVMYLSDDSGRKAVLKNAYFESYPMRFTAVVSGPSGVNATAQIFIPLGAFADDRFIVAANSTYGSSWNSTSRILMVWVLLGSDVFITVMPPETQEPTAPRFFINTGLVDLDVLEPGSTTDFSIPVEFNSHQITVTQIYFGGAAGGWVEAPYLPATFTRGLTAIENALIEARITVPANATSGSYTIPFTVYAVDPEGQTAQAGANIMFTVAGPATGGIGGIGGAISDLIGRIGEAVVEAVRRLVGNPLALALFIACVIWLSYYALRKTR